jgi:hypothetical protein
MLLAWVMLLILPWFIAEWRVYRWRQRFPGPAERQGPFFAFMRSSIGVVTSIVSAVLVLAFNLPTALGFEAAAGPALAHLLVVYLSTLRPLHRLDREVRGAPGDSWPMPAPSSAWPWSMQPCSWCPSARRSSCGP